MSKEIVISATGDQSRIAIVEDGQLVELYVESPENIRTIGDIYLGRVRRILPGIKAAFVDVGQKQDAFLHFSDLSDNLAQLLELAEGKVSAPAPEEPQPEKKRPSRPETKRSESKPRGRSRGTRDAKKASAEDTKKASAEDDRPAPAGRARPPRSAASGAGLPASPSILPPDAEIPEIAAADRPDASSGQEDEAQGEEKRVRSRRRRGRRRSQRQTGGGSPEATEAIEPQESSSEKSPPKRTASSPPKQPAPTVIPDKAPPKPPSGPAAGEDERDASSPPVLAPGSRFRIDLTGGSSTQRPPDRPREEEEEEEERPTRRKTRAGRGSGRGRQRSDKEKSESASSQNGKPQESSGPHPSEHLRQDQRILVKIIKEPISAKGSRVSTDISLAGRFLVLVPAADYVAVSKKIESAKERRRLRALARSLLPEGLGLIVRTVAEKRDAKALDADLSLLLEKWRKIEDQLRARPDPPVKLYEDVSMVSSIIRDLFTDDYDRIVIDDPKLYRNVRSYVQAVAPQMTEAVKLHQRKEPVFRTFKIEADIRAAFESRVSLPGGGYLIIEHTEAMHVVDVNSGRAGRGLSQEQNALKVNLEAARELAKQLRLRDLGGIICVDFIDMRSDAYRKKLFDELKREFRRDRAVTKMLPMSDFGVMEITRQRLRPSITTTLDVEELGSEPPAEAEEPEAALTSKRSAAEVVAHLERWLQNYREKVQERHRRRPVLVRVHPFLAAYLQRGIPSLFTRWKLRTRLKMRLEIDDSVDPLSFTVRDEKSGKNLTRRFDPDRGSA